MLFNFVNELYFEQTAEINVESLLIGESKRGNMLVAIRLKLNPIPSDLGLECLTLIRSCSIWNKQQRGILNPYY